MSSSTSLKTCAFSVALILLLCGCATPIEIKQASQKQLELIDSLDDAVKGLAASVDSFYRDHSDLVRLEGRMQVARAAVIKATETDGEVTADELFTTYQEEVHPWIRHAFAVEDLAARIAAVEEAIEAEADPVQKHLLQRQLNDLRLLQADSSGRTPRPGTVEAIDQTTRETIQRNAETAAAVQKSLKNLRSQIALMRLMQSKVDAWLAIDVSPSQEQIDGLTKSIGDAHATLSGEAE